MKMREHCREQKKEIPILKDNWKFGSNNPEAGLFVVDEIEDFDKDLVMWNGSWIRAPRRSRK